MYRPIVCIISVALFAGCAKPVATPPHRQNAPTATAYANKPEKDQDLTDPARSLPPEEFLQARTKVLTQLFTRYFQGRAAGDASKIATLTGGVFQQEALLNLSDDKGAAFEVLSVATPKGGVYDPQVSTTVTFRRNGEQMKATFRLTLNGSWRITDTLDPLNSSRWLSERNSRKYLIKDFFEQYYAARRRGDRSAVETMTGGAYRERALVTLGQTPPPDVVEDIVSWYGSLDEQTVPIPTVVHLRAGERGALTYKVEPAGRSWRITDLLDPASGRWVSDKVRVLPFPDGLAPSLEAHLRQFYKVRSFADKHRLDDLALYRLANDQYAIYIRNVIRATSATAEQYEVTSVRVIEWTLDQTETGTAEAQVTGTLSRTDLNGKSIATSFMVRLRVHRQGDSWHVVDEFVPDEGAWLSTMVWKGLFIAAG